METVKTSQNREGNKSLEIISFSNQTREDKKRLKQFVDFHWNLYRNDDRYVPLLDYEYLGFKLIGIKSFLNMPTCGFLSP
jgi:hypothetical protein